MTGAAGDGRADSWLHASTAAAADLLFMGAPTAALSLSPSRADTTPAELRRVLRRFPLWDAETEVALATVRCHDAGDIDMAGDPVAARERLAEAVAGVVGRDSAPALAICGGDNSITAAAVTGLARGLGVALDSGAVGLVTIDAHHDMRDPSPRPNNGSPVAELLAAGLPGRCIAQVGISRFGNQEELGERARAAGVRVFDTAAIARDGIGALMDDALSMVAAQHIYLDVDLDVLDRAFAPACPASMPGGLTPRELLDAVGRAAFDRRVVAMDLVEVDAAADVADITLRMAGSVLLVFAAGLARRRRPEA
ncbi:MAG: formiminoglutamase [Chloroflexota bacterium]|nr:formiminoglutamase [Chloroflexota bacterium]